MTIEAAQQWFKQHPHIIPAPESNLQPIHELFEEGDTSNDLVKLATADPAIILDILRQVNARRGANSGLDIIESPSAAFAMLGSQAKEIMLKKFPVAEQHIKDPEQLFLFHQLINRSYHNEYQAEIWGKEIGFQQLEKLKLPALLAYIGEILCCVYDYPHYKQYLLSGGSEAQCTKVFGFLFSELTEVACLQLHLPESIIQLQPHVDSRSQSSELLHYTSRLCHLIEHGWYTDRVLLLQQKFSEGFELPLDRVWKQTRDNAIAKTRYSIIPDAWQPASRLILVKDELWTPTPEELAQEPVADTVRPNASATNKQPSENSSRNQTANTKPVETKPVVKTQAAVAKAPLLNDKPTAMDKIKKLAQSTSTTQTDLLGACMRGLKDDLDLGKVNLILLSRDKTQLQSRMALGIDKQDPLKTYAVAVKHSGLMRSLLNKPSAIWINQENIGKYHQVMPEQLLATINTDNFMLMSLFINDKPVGIIYADCSNNNQQLSVQVFSQFKQIITLSSKALTLVAKRQQSG